MTDIITELLRSPNAWMFLIFLSFAGVVILHLSRKGLINIHTENVTVGASTKERNIIRQQTEWAHAYIMGLESEITTGKDEYNSYFTKYILERIYDEVIDWITFNHINLESDYVSIKQQLVKSIIRGMGVKPEFRTKEFEKKMDKWTEEVITKLVLIRDMHK